MIMNAKCIRIWNDHSLFEDTIPANIWEDWGIPQNIYRNSSWWSLESNLIPLDIRIGTTVMPACAVL